MKMFFLLLVAISLSAECQEPYVKISVNSQDVEINRFYYLDDFDNVVFLESENEISLIYNNLQLIDGKNSISYILTAGDDITIPYTDAEYAFPESKTSPLRSKEIQYSVEHYKKFQTKFFSEFSLPMALIDTLYITNSKLRDSLFSQSLKREIEYLKNYKEQHKLSDAFFSDQEKMLISFYVERDLIAGFFPFENNYLSSVLDRSIAYLKDPDLLYLNSFKRSLMYYLKTQQKIDTEKEYIQIVNENFESFLNTYIKAYLINEALKNNDRSLINIENAGSVTAEFLKECKVERFCAYISQKIRTQELEADQLMDVNLNHVKFDEIGKERTTYIAFWASWCGPCIKSIKETTEIRSQLSKENVDVVFISIDKEIENWRKRVAKLNLDDYSNYIISESSVIHEIFDTSSIPKYAVVKKGEVVFHDIGPLSEPETINKIRSVNR
jgi:thiol-disulfide isomerase/thioredoxin